MHRWTSRRQGMTKEKTRGDEASEIGRQNMAHAYSAMDYYFDNLKKTVASAHGERQSWGEKLKACAEQTFPPPKKFSVTLSYAADIQVCFSQMIIRCAIGSFWRAGRRPARGLYQSSIRSNEKTIPVWVIHDPLLST